MDEEQPRRRKSVRRPDHDYGWRSTYFVTIVTHDRFCWFGDVIRDTVELNPLGQAVLREWLAGPAIRPGLVLGAWVLMPNHLHAIVTVPARASRPFARGVADAPESRGWQQPALDSLGRPVVTQDLASLVRGFKGAAKSAATKIRQMNEPWDLWQRNYHEHIIRDAADGLRIERYITANPSRWQFDAENVDANPDDFERSFWTDLES